MTTMRALKARLDLLHSILKRAKNPLMARELAPIVGADVSTTQHDLRILEQKGRAQRTQVAEYPRAKKAKYVWTAA